jgi:hypothetical protein
VVRWLEAAFGHFGGAPQEVLIDNARALVDEHDAATREVRFNARLVAFARYWGFRPRACAPKRHPELDPLRHEELDPLWTTWTSPPHWFLSSPIGTALTRPARRFSRRRYIGARFSQAQPGRDLRASIAPSRYRRIRFGQVLEPAGTDMGQDLMPPGLHVVQPIVDCRKVLPRLLGGRSGNLEGLSLGIQGSQPIIQRAIRLGL